MIFWQHELQLTAKPRGFHLITDEIDDALRHAPSVSVGLLHILIKHTSASLTLNENADPAVRRDFERYFQGLAPDTDRNTPYEHTYEGPDDLPAHFKASLLGSHLTLPGGAPEPWHLAGRLPWRAPDPGLWPSAGADPARSTSVRIVDYVPDHAGVTHPERRGNER